MDKFVYTNEEKERMISLCNDLATYATLLQITIDCDRQFLTRYAVKTIVGSNSKTNLNHDFVKVQESLNEIKTILKKYDLLE